MRTNRYFYQIGQTVYFVDDDSDNLYEQTLQEKLDDAKAQYNYFESFKGYETTHDSLIQFKNDFNKWNAEIKSIPNCSIDYTKYYNHESAVTMTFKSKSTSAIKAIHWEPITYKEFAYFERCNNGGLITLDERYKNKIVQSYGYDFSSFYPSMLAMKGFQIPTKEGKLKHFAELDFDNLQYGIYKVKIICNDSNFNKLFAFSPNNYYTHYALQFAYENRDRFNIEFDLITDCEHNALVYYTTSLVESTKLFKPWYNYLMTIKQKFPKNKLVKHLLSSLWGMLIKFKREFYEDEIFDELDISELDGDEETEYKLINERRYKDDSYENGIRILYEVVKSDNAYCSELARLKPFFVSFCRVHIGDLIIQEELVNKVIRIHTDGLVFTEPHDFTHLFYYPIPEDKSTGLIKWENVNRYEKLDV
ncbi:MAG: hypothetical protein RLZZ293_1242 [Pseudomonadota bacterium]|jgi:hypothetical protein